MALKQQVALVLGGASGIGLATARELLAQGANVAVCDVSSEAGEAVAKVLQNEHGTHRCFFVSADVRNDVEFENALTAAKERFKKVDIIVNSAGVLNDYDWNLTVDVNLKGIIRGTLLAWKHIGKEGGGAGGVVVNVASILGLTYMNGIPAYTATKHAVVGFGRSSGAPCSFERTGVRVITMCPGVTDTPLLAPKNQPQFHNEALTQEFNREIVTYPSQTPDNVAKAILHVIQHAASGSVWVSEGGEPPYEVVIPERQDMSVTR